MGFSLVAASRGGALAVVCRLLTAVASLAARALTLGRVGSAVGDPGLGSTGSVVAMGLSCSVASSNPVSPALTGRFLTTEPLEKSKGSFESTFPRGVGVRVTEGRSCVAEEAVGAPPPPPPSGQAHCSPSAGSLLFLLHIIIIIIIFLAAWHVGSYFSNQGSNPCPLQGKHRVLTTGQPREFLFSMFSASWWVSEFPVFSEKLSPLSGPCLLCPSSH